MRKTSAVLLLFGASFFISAVHVKQSTTPAMDDKTLPSLVLSDIHGKKVNVADYGKSGQITVISFWATWCIPCKKELTNISALYEDWQKKYNVKVVAVSIDDSRNTAKVKPYVDGQRWTFDVLLDVNQDLKRAINFTTVPYTIVVSKTGKISYAHGNYIEGDEYVLEEELQKLSKN